MRGRDEFFLIEENGKYTVVDAGAPRDWALLENSLRELGAKPGDPDAVLLIHAHPDHVGFAEKARADAGAQVWIQQADAEAARTQRTPSRPVPVVVWWASLCLLRA